jgi:hypothetical protein
MIFLLTSTGQTGELISMVNGSNDAFPPKEVTFRGLIEKIWLHGVSNSQKPPKVGVVYDFPAKLEDSIKTHISVKSRDIDTEFELWVETKNYRLDFGSKVTYHQIQDGGSRH